MTFGISAAASSFGFAVDVPPQNPNDDTFGGLSLQFQYNGTPLGGPDATILNFTGAGLSAVRATNTVTVLVDGGGGGGSSGDVESIPGVVTDGVTDNFALMSAALSDAGSYVTAAKPRFRFGTTGPVLIGGLLDVHPSLSCANDARGVTVLVPGDNLPAVTAGDPYDAEDNPTGQGGAEAAFIRIPRRTIDSDLTLSFSPVYRGLNLDARGTTQINPVHGVRIPNPDKTENDFDPDPDFDPDAGGNKDYVAGEWYNMDIVGFPGSGMALESSNGRLHLHSVRALNNGLFGFDMGGNDIVVSGHSAAGGNGNFGFKIGNASGFFGTTINVWAIAGSRSLTCGAMWFNQRKLFGLAVCEFNDWNRFTGGDSAWRGGVVGLNCYAPFNEIFSADGIARDGGSGDERLQSSNGIDTYRSADFIGNKYFRSTATNKVTQPAPGAFGSWMNIGGDLDGKFGTAFRWFIDASNKAHVNTFDQVNSGPNVKPWTGPQAVFTVDISGALPATATFTSTAHGLVDGTRIALTTTGALPTGLRTGVSYFVRDSDTNTFKLADYPGGAAIATTGSQSPTHKWGAIDSLPYNTRGGGQLNYVLQNSFNGETRFGMRGPQHARLLLGIAETDFGEREGTSAVVTVDVGTDVFTSVAHGLKDNYPIKFTTTGFLPTGLATNVEYWTINTTADTFQVSADYDGLAVDMSGSQSPTHTFYSWWRTYAIEAGDRTLPSNRPFRHALRGMWEFQNGVQYMDGAFDGRAFTNSLTRTVKAGQRLQRLVVAGAGIAGATIQLPTDMKANQFLTVLVTGGPVAVLTWTTISVITGLAAGSLAASTSTVPAFTTGFTKVQLWYEKGNNAWYCLDNSNETPNVTDVTALTNLTIRGSASFVGMLAGATLGSFDLVGVDAAGTLVKAHAGNGIPAVGLIKTGFAIGEKVVYFKRGIARRTSWTWTPGQTIYLSPFVSSEFTSTRPAGSGMFAQPVGIALTSDTIDFDVSPNYTQV